MSGSSAIVEYKSPSSYYKLEKYDQQRVLPGSCQPPSVKEQKEKVNKELVEKPMEKDEVWCLIEKRWFDSWKVYVQFEDTEATEAGGDAPGPIDNEVLLDNAEEFQGALTAPEIPLMKLKPVQDCQENSHFNMIPSEAWDYLFKWFGGAHMGYAPTLARHTYKRSITASTYVLDTRPYFLNCAFLDKEVTTYSFKVFRFCKFILFKDMKSVLNSHWNINPRLSSCRVADTRLWVAYLGSPWKHVEAEHVELQAFEEGYMDGRQFILEPRYLTEKFKLDFLSVDSRKPSYQSSSYGSYGSSSSSYGYSRTRYDESYYKTNTSDNNAGTPGTCGLGNLGNTCYMNSAVQCLTKIEPIRDYFLSGEYKNDINEDNPLGYKGEVAKAFAEIMDLMWSGKNKKISPRGFKYTIGKHREIFSGYGQQDSHEVISFLLDSIHEDLNRVKKKPYTEGVEARGRPDDVVALECWNGYKLRNDSVVVDNFQGQLRSEVMCPKCLGISIKFDPYTYLSVPVPGVAMRKLNVTVVFKNKKPMMFRVKVKKMGLIFNLRENLAEMCGVDSQRLVIAEIFHHKIYIVYSDNDRVGAIKDHETIAAFELSDEHIKEEKDLRHGSYMRGLSPFGEFQVVQKEVREVSYYTYFGQRREMEQYTKEISPWPFVLYVPNETFTAKQMYDRAFKVIKSYITEEGKAELLKRGIDVDDEKDLSKIFPLGSTKDYESFEKIKKEIAERKEKERIEKEEKKKKEEEKKKKREEAAKKGEKIKEEEEEVTMTPRPPTPPKDDKKDDEKTLKERPPTPPKDGPVPKEGDAAKAGGDADAAAAAGGDNKKQSFQKLAQEGGAGHAGLPSFQHQGNKKAGEAGKKSSSSYQSSSSKKKEPEIVDPERLELDKRPVLFKLNQYPDGLNYHSSTRNRKGRTLYYTDEQLVNVPPHPEISRYASTYYTYYSASRDKYHIKFEILIPEGFDKFLDMKKMPDFEKHESCNEKKNEEEKKKKKMVLTLSKCIEKFCEKEVLTKQNTFYCSRCKEHVEATKKIDIWSVPKVLIIQLKRFQSSEFSSYRTKIEKLIDYPLELDMSPFCVSKDQKFRNYKLFAVSNHYGGLGGGHYTACASAPKKGTEIKDGKFGWYDFNDSFVKDCSEKSAVSSAGYILFYKSDDDNGEKKEEVKEKKEEVVTPKEEEETPKKEGDDEETPK